ncbi:hypothetical protein LJB93_02065 [Desulfovibrio sp. OttesenSCG-928-F07]|nr:hypothetical protein [Desulfovibrio sp. OttesenSCG-928-F07]
MKLDTDIWSFGMFKNTLISLAVIRTLANSEKNFLDFIVPFAYEAAQNISSPFNCTDICKYIADNFGLRIPERTIELTIKKIMRKGFITKQDKKYNFIEVQTKGLCILQHAESARLIIDEVISNIKLFAEEKTGKEYSDEQIIDAIIHFLSLFSVDCLKFYHQQSVLPVQEIRKENWQVILISAYITAQQKLGKNTLDKFMIVAYGHMLTTSLLCPDLKEATKAYNGVRFFFDTSNIIESLGLDGTLAQESAKLLFKQIKGLGGKICCFTHTVDEIKHVIHSSANFINKDSGVGGIVQEARRQGVEAADLISFAETIEDNIDASGIEIVASPSYIKDFQIDEKKFEAYLDKSLKYKNINAKHIDINSIRCVFALRKNERAITIEKTKAIFVTKNTNFAQAACEYSFDIENVILSPVIDSYTLANIAWLKSPMDAPLLPAKELIAFSYAALRPDETFWKSVISQAEKLQSSGEISATQLQIIRGSVEVQEHIITSTLGDEDKISKETITDAVLTATLSIENKVREESELAITRLQDQLNLLNTTLKEKEKEKQENENKKIEWCKNRSYTLGTIVYYILLVLISVILIIIKQPNLNEFFGLLNITIPNKMVSLIVTHLNELIGTVLFISGVTFDTLKKKISNKIFQHMLGNMKKRGELITSPIDGLSKN